MFTQNPSGDLLDLTGTYPVPPKRDRRGPCLPAGRKGYNMNETSMARIRLATACPGSPFDILRAMSFAERPRPVSGELHNNTPRTILTVGMGSTGSIRARMEPRGQSPWYLHEIPSYAPGC
jgi:hypothetical protein